MKSTLFVLLVLLPGLALSQSLTEVAKKEKERREKNKQEGKEALVISEDQLATQQAGGSGQAQVEGGTTGSTRSASGPSRPGSDDGGDYDEESEYMEEDVPQSIPPDIPLEQRLERFQRMKRYYEQQVREIDNAIAENNQRLRQLQAKIGATSALGGAGLPVAPQTGTGAARAQMTGQESQQLLAEQKKLQTMNGQMEKRKEQLKLDLQTKGRVAGIPPGYLRF